MSLQPTTVLDASALLAYLQGETGATIVATTLTQGSVISAINWAETLIQCCIAYSARTATPNA